MNADEALEALTELIEYAEDCGDFAGLTFDSLTWSPYALRAWLAAQAAGGER